MSLETMLSPRIAELGKLKIGGLGEERQSQRGGTYRLPEKYDHFVVTTMQRDRAGGLIVDEALMATLREEGFADPDGKIRRIPVSFLSNDPEDVIQCCWIAYEGKKVAARSDGVELTKFFDYTERRWLPQPVKVPWKPEFAAYAVGEGNQKRTLFKKHTTLSVVVASRGARWGGYYKFRTTSVISGDQLLGSIQFIRENLTFGQLRGVPLQLAVRPIQVAPDGQAKTVYVVHLEARGETVEAIQQKAMQVAEFEVKYARQIGTAHKQYLQLMRHPDEFDDGDDEDLVGQEFHATGAAAATSPPAIAATAPPSPPPAPPPPPVGDDVIDQGDADDQGGDDEPDDTGHVDPFAGAPVNDMARREADAAAAQPPPPPPPAANGQPRIGGELVTRILTGLGDVDVDWSMVRADRIGPDLKPGTTEKPASGICAAIGIEPSTTLRCKDLAAEAGLKLFKLVETRLAEKAARAAKRNGSKA